MKPIHIKRNTINEILKEFEKDLEKSLFGNISFKRKIPPENQDKVEVNFSSNAYVKMMWLIQHFKTEVAWHGVCERVDKNLFKITDILVYPQKVTGATVDMDTEKYSMWIMENCEDERFNHIRMQGHSHVDMDVYPSGTDTKHQMEIFKQLKEDDYYIFVIANKKHQFNIVIYDLKYNRMIEEDDIEISFGDDVEFMKNAILQVDNQNTITPKMWNGLCEEMFL